MPAPPQRPGRQPSGAAARGRGSHGLRYPAAAREHESNPALVPGGRAHTAAVRPRPEAPRSPAGTPPS
eukprot:4748680-Lingulodinium_polyedra.AAC.1